jgi:hypothetical protein
MVDAALHDVRAACRIMRKSPLLSVATIVILAIDTTKHTKETPQSTN